MLLAVGRLTFCRYTGSVVQQSGFSLLQRIITDCKKINNTSSLLIIPGSLLADYKILL